jgi:hypothetical protein
MFEAFEVRRRIVLNYSPEGSGRKPVGWGSETLTCQSHYTVCHAHFYFNHFQVEVRRQ